MTGTKKKINNLTLFFMSLYLPLPSQRVYEWKWSMRWGGVLVQCQQESSPGILRRNSSRGRRQSFWFSGGSMFQPCSIITSLRTSLNIGSQFCTTGEHPRGFFCASCTAGPHIDRFSVQANTVTCLKKASWEGEHTEFNVVQIQCEHLAEDSVHGYHLMLQSCKKSSAYWSD